MKNEAKKQSKMDKLTDWLTNNFTPRAEKMLSNPWLSALSNSFNKILPFIFASTVVSCYSLVSKYLFSSLPNLDFISTYSFSLISLFLVFIIPYLVMENKSHDKFKLVTGLLSIAIFLMMLNPTINNNIMSISFNEFGAGGIMYAMVIGLLVAAIFNFWANRHWLENSETIPSFVADWINALIPIFFSLLFAYILVGYLHFNLSSAITKLLRPLFSFGQTYIGFIIILEIPAILYTFGIATRTTSAIRKPIMLAGIAANIALVKQGLAPTNIVTNEVIFSSGLLCLGGTGCTLPLVIYMCRSKVKRLRTMGKVTIGPSIFNINEPVIYGVPIVFNPLLMLPIWINSFTGPTILWFAMKAGLLSIPRSVIDVGQLPVPISSFLTFSDWRAFIWAVILFVVYAITWWPFFKVYEKQLLDKQAAEDISTQKIYASSEV
jgi:Phosphotransferase system cellobiose-specific component IIC